MDVASVINRMSLTNKAWSIWAWEGYSPDEKSFSTMERTINILKKVAGKSKNVRLRNFKKIAFYRFDKLRGGPKIIDRIATICPSISTVILSECAKFTSAQVISFLQRLPMLKTVEFSYTRKGTQFT